MSCYAFLVAREMRFRTEIRDMPLSAGYMAHVLPDLPQTSAHRPLEDARPTMFFSA
jgi:hypothetical protein